MKWWFEIDLWKRVIAALVLGTLAGIALRAGLGADAAAAFATDWVKWLGDLFLRLIRMLVVPLVFFTLVSGMIAMGDPKRLGSLGLRTIGLYFATTAFAVTLGLILATLFQPGASLTPDIHKEAEELNGLAKAFAGDDSVALCTVSQIFSWAPFDCAKEPWKCFASWPSYEVMRAMSFMQPVLGSRR